MSNDVSMPHNLPHPPMADIETASEDYATRFAGPSGKWLLKIQERGVRYALKRATHTPTVLDVGGGHAQLTHVYLEQERNVTIAGSAAEPAGRLQTFLSNPNCKYQYANLLQLPYPKKSFQLVASFRLLTHCEQWEQLVEQLCRVSQQYVMIDYPTSQSINAIAPALFDAKKKIEKNTRYWRSFRHKEVDAAFSEHGFKRITTYKQFFFPMALHRMLQCRPLSCVIEGIARASGLTRWLGSPVIALYQFANTEED